MKRMRSERPVWGDARALLHLLRASPEQPDWCHENSPRPALPRTVCLRWRLLPARGDRPLGALVSALRAVVPRRRELLAEVARPCRHAVGGRWQVDETYVKVAGRWRYVYRAIDQFGQVIDVFVSHHRDAQAARRFFERAIDATKVAPAEVTTDQASVYLVVLEELLPAPWHRTDRYANNRVECDHGRLKARLRPMRDLKQESQ